jgi:hypothetical protein
MNFKSYSLKFSQASSHLLLFLHFLSLISTFPLSILLLSLVFKCFPYFNPLSHSYITNSFRKFSWNKKKRKIKTLSLRWMQTISLIMEGREKKKLLFQLPNCLYLIYLSYIWVIILTSCIISCRNFHLIAWNNIPFKNIYLFIYFTFLSFIVSSSIQIIHI